MDELLPGVEQRFCVRHIYKNFRKRFLGKMLKKIIWKTAKSTYSQAWEREMKGMKDVNVDAYNKNLLKHPNKHLLMHPSKHLLMHPNKHPNKLLKQLLKHPSSQLMKGQTSNQLEGYLNQLLKHLIT